MKCIDEKEKRYLLVQFITLANTTLYSNYKFFNNYEDACLTLYKLRYELEKRVSSILCPHDYLKLAGIYELEAVFDKDKLIWKGDHIPDCFLESEDIKGAVEQYYVVLYNIEKDYLEIKPSAFGREVIGIYGLREYLRLRVYIESCKL